jgi:DNA-binding transcriptional regulator YiaG
LSSHVLAGPDHTRYGFHTVSIQPYENELLERLRAKRTLPAAIERRRLREAAGASLRDVARALGTSPTSVIRWERGGSPGSHSAAYARLLEEFKRIAPD